MVYDYDFYKRKAATACHSSLRFVVGSIEWHILTQKFLWRFFSSVSSLCPQVPLLPVVSPPALTVTAADHLVMAEPLPCTAAWPCALELLPGSPPSAFASVPPPEHFDIFWTYTLKTHTWLPPATSCLTSFLPSQTFWTFLQLCSPGPSQRAVVWLL